MRYFWIAFVVLTGVMPFARAQPGVGARYGTRDPLLCSSKRDPVNGVLSPGQAARYFRCGPSGERILVNQLYLFENVKVEIGKGRTLQGGGMSGGSDANMHDIDPSFPVYPIHGSFEMYRCSTPDRGVKAGQNCSLSTIPQSSGACYKTTFGDWTCNMASDNPSADIVQTGRKLPGPR
jgi:hypothetical protein